MPDADERYTYTNYWFVVSKYIFLLLSGLFTLLEKGFRLHYRSLQAVYCYLELRIKRFIRPSIGALNQYPLRLKKFIRPSIGALNQYPPRPFLQPQHLPSLRLKIKPTISIVTPSFNQGHFLEKTIQSVINQRYEALEYIIQDGGSNDSSVDVIKHYAPHLKHWESCRDLGQSNAINLGFQHASGEIMAYLNSDDILLPGTLHYVADYFNRHPKVDVIYGHRILINENDQEVGRWILPPHKHAVLSWADYIPQETLFWRRRIWDKAGGQIDESFKFAMDWDLLLRFRDAKGKFVRLPRFLGAFRIHSNQKSSAQILDLGMREMERIRMKCHGRPVTHREIYFNLAVYLARHHVLSKGYQLGIIKY